MPAGTPAGSSISTQYLELKNMKSKVKNPVFGFAILLKKVVINMDQHFRASNPIFDRISAAKDQTLRATYHLYGQSK